MIVDATGWATTSDSGDRVVEMLVHDVLVKAAILVVGLVVLAVALVVVWRLAGRRRER